MKKFTIIAVVLAVIIAVAGWAVFRDNNQKEKEVLSSRADIDAFAKCLTEKGAVMYGAYWCSHCQAQKKLFGESFRYVKYVECTKELKLCTSKKINGYPTWFFKNGKSETGELSLEELAKRTSCKLPSN